MKVCQTLEPQVVDQWACHLVQVPQHQGEIPGTSHGEPPGVGMGRGTYALHLGNKEVQEVQGDPGHQGVCPTCLEGIPV